VDYIAIFAVCDSILNNSVFPGFSPFENEADLSAGDHAKFLKFVLGDIFKRSIENVRYLVGGNIVVNRKLSRDLDIPLIGCNSHKLNLAAQEYLGQKKETKVDKYKRTVTQSALRTLLTKLTELMKNLQTIKGKATLRNFEAYVAVYPNETRWDGNFRMVDRFV